MPALNTPTSVTQQPQNKIMGPPAPPEDRYAALKDLDNALKAQSNLDWNSGSSSSLQSSPTPAGSVYSSPSPQGSLYGSPSQGEERCEHFKFSRFYDVITSNLSTFNCWKSTSCIYIMVWLPFQDSLRVCSRVKSLAAFQIRSIRLRFGETLPVVI